jgi:hypothetical protein
MLLLLAESSRTATDWVDHGRINDANISEKRKSATNITLAGQ